MSDKNLEERSQKIQDILEDDSLSEKERIIKMRKYLLDPKDVSKPSKGSLIDRLNSRLGKNN